MLFILRHLQPELEKVHEMLVEMKLSYKKKKNCLQPAKVKMY